MRALRKLAFLLASAGAALVSCASTSACAQDVPAPQTNQSRIYPHPPENGIPMPIPSVSRPPQPAPREDNWSSATTSELVNSMRLCRATVSPHFEVQPRVLAEDGWGYTMPRREQNALGNFESVRYYKNHLTLGLLDFGQIVLCRVVARIADIEQLNELRVELASELGAIPLRDAQGMEAYVDIVSRNRSDAELMNIMIVGDYSLELAIQAVDASNMGLSDESTVTIILLTSAPLPIQFQSGAQSSTPE